MDVILHLGAHRTATTTFQHYLRDHVDDLAGQHVAYWGPQRCRKSVFPGLFRSVVGAKRRNVARRAEGRIRMFSQQAQSCGVRQLVVSDENLLGNCAQNLRAERLYPGAGERTAKVSAAFGGRLRRIVLSIRSPELFWASASALTVSLGHPVPSAARFDAIAQSRRTWRDVITDLACAAPGAEIKVLPFEAYAGRPDVILRAALDRNAPRDTKRRWLNRSQDIPALRATLSQNGASSSHLPDGVGRWQPFTDEQIAQLRETYADDLHWLTAGGDGLATLTENAHLTRADTSLPTGAMTKGQGYDEGQLAQHR
ncbi:MAG: hypothetical protein HKP51_07215 [Sulfitobacter sp.]|nr:hypothetical protein [Sulfitobacter sp.]